MTIQIGKKDDEGLDENSGDQIIINNTSTKFIGGITTLILFFWGSPDLMDGLIYFLTDGKLM